ncbi:helix-turn-helix domain-containing protein [Bythopirellula polymerisocia]|jgi:transcriptional regulator GlxA family with amidase domain|uniref:Regulatory protein SoxS n=1 Tax=Bythopirellula polymerisocia TaxID=2528003 RepID=A0A5C6D3L8_9BACT|nr:AraC family transcriptional regulator [Bythopirellula polymerisocia]TWU30464.1 Regulatory protein SoxS [Bythopirellula polymerisocia]
MIDNSSNQIALKEALQVVRMLKSRSAVDFVWEQVEKVLLSEEVSSKSVAAAESRSQESFDGPRRDSCCCSHSESLDGHSLVRYDDDRLQKALCFIHQHLDESIGVQEITREICVSRRWLEYAFRAAFGITPFQYVRCVRLELARLQLISEPQYKVHQIALNLGFTSARQFAMTFRQHFGYSPSVWRNQNADDCAASFGSLAEAC